GESMRRLLVTTATALLIACGAFSKDDIGTTDPPTPEDNSKPPIEGTPLEGIFVSAHGPADGDGTAIRPFPTLAGGIARAATVHQKVIACAKEYKEAIVLPDGVSIYGYFDCTDYNAWKKDINKRATVRSPTSPAFLAIDFKAPTRVDGLEIVAPDQIA